MPTRFPRPLWISMCERHVGTTRQCLLVRLPLPIVVPLLHSQNISKPTLFTDGFYKLCLHVLNPSNLKFITRNTGKSQWANEPIAFAAAIRAVYCVSSQPPTVPSDIAVPRGLFITPGLPVVWIPAISHWYQVRKKVGASTDAHFTMLDHFKLQETHNWAKIAKTTNQNHGLSAQGYTRQSAVHSPGPHDFCIRQHSPQARPTLLAAGPLVPQATNHQWLPWMPHDATVLFQSDLKRQIPQHDTICTACITNDNQPAKPH